MTERLHHPSEREYLQAAVELDSTFADLTLTVVREKMMAALPAGMAARLGVVATILNPLDTNSGEYVYKHESVHNAYTLGVSTGMELARRAYHPEIKRTFSDAISVGSQFADDPVAKHELVTYFVQFGENGVHKTGPAVKDWLDDKAELPVPDVRVQRMFRIGFGFMIELIHGYFEPIFAERRQKLDTKISAITDDEFNSFLRSL